jgi:hypothetical protein
VAAPQALNSHRSARHARKMSSLCVGSQRSTHRVGDCGVGVAAGHAALGAAEIANYPDQRFTSRDPVSLNSTLWNFALRLDSARKQRGDSMTIA